MGPTEWVMLAGVAATVVMTVAPWAGMVHARLAVLAAQVASLEATVQKLLRVYEECLPRAAVWEARLAAVEEEIRRLDRQLAQVD